MIITNIFYLLYWFYNREDRETELLLKLDDYECRERSNGRMIDHLNKTISKNKERIRTAKKRYKELNNEMSKMKKKVIESDEVVVNGRKKKKIDGSSNKGTK